ncbi:MAG: RagB/SusD family nutrient uptake outer membrane protein, partial [Bacteroidota bacterium]|nr:RagB/SusD family nutrient uptake outer membrane protein [Bacteroidota bacterium]
MELFTTNAPSELYPPSVTSTADRFIHFMLNERTRELCGEFYRWEDLARTETLYDRTKLFNKDATNLQPYHRLRPIPQIQIDLTTVNGQPMSGDQKKAYQNQGY